MTTFTVTATQGGSTAGNIQMTLKVVTGAAAVQPGITGAVGNATPFVTVTPQATGSWVYGALLGTGTQSLESGTTQVQEHTSSGSHYLNFRTTSTTTSGTPISVGYATGTGVGSAACEILAATTLAEDASSPALTAFSTTTSATTAAFSPVPGSLLVLTIASNGGAGTTTMSVTDTSGLHLKWIEQVKQNGSGAGYDAVWTAFVLQHPSPSGPARSVTALLPPQSGGTGGRYGRILSTPQPAPQAAPPPTPGPPVYPLPGPVTARLRVQPPRGRAQGLLAPPPVPPVIPPLYPLQGPVHAPFPARRRGGAVHHRAGTFSGEGPALSSLTMQQPVGNRVTPVRTGHSQYQVGQYSGTGPPVYPLQGPVRARIPQVFSKGRALSTPPFVPPVTFPAPLYPLQQPVAVRVIYRPAGSAQASPVPVQQGTGPAFTPLTQPAGIRYVLARTGHVQTLPGTFEPSVPSPAYPLTGPVRARIPQTFSKGRAHHRAGTFSQYGPPLIPPQGPARARIPQVFSKGRIQSSPGTASGYGPPVTPLTQPVTARRPGPYLHGRAMTMALLILSVYGPPVTAPRGPVRAPVPQAFSRGRVLSTPPYVPPSQGTGPAVSSLTQPVRARLAPPSQRGHARTRAGAPVSFSGPAVSPQQGPVRARVPAPFSKGRSLSTPPYMAPSSVSPPPLYPLHGPVGLGNRAPGPVLHGRAMTMSLLVYTTTVPSPAYPQHQPARAPIPARVRGGTAHRRPGAIAGTGPQVTPLTGPVRARIPAPYSKGRALSTPQYAPSSVAVAVPLHRPVKAQPAYPVLQGRVIRRAGTFSGTGPEVTPLTAPVAARRPQPARYGRGAGSPGTFGGQGPVLRPPSGPVSDRRPLNAPRGRTVGNPGGPVVPPPPVPPPPATLYLTPGTITQAGPYAAVGVTSTGSLLTISPEQDTALTIGPEEEGIAPVQVSPAPSVLLPSPDETTLFPDLPG